MDGDPKHVGKPENILEKIADGKLKTRLAESVLTEQQMANADKYPKTTVGAWWTNIVRMQRISSDPWVGALSRYGPLGTQTNASWSKADFW